MNRNVFEGEATRYEEIEEKQAATQLDEDNEFMQADTEYEDEEDRFLDTVFEEEEDEDEEPDRAVQDSEAEEEILYQLGDYYVTTGSAKLGGGGQADVYQCFRKGSTDIFAAKIHKKDLPREKIEVIETICDMEDECESIYKIYKAGYAERESDQSKAYMIVTKQYKKLSKKYLNFEHRREGKGGERAYYERLRCAVEDLNNALTAMHNVRIKGSESHIYHSDIKPKNIMWDPDGRKGKGCLVLIDFDGGVVNDTDASKTNLAGTKLYIPPELLRVKKSRVNEYTDNYSLGITLAELIAGVMPAKDFLSYEESEAGRAYYEKYKENGIEIQNVYFSPELPEYVQTLFNGLLYYDAEEGKEGQKKRWNDEMLRKWIRLVTVGRYKDAAELPCGSPIVQAGATGQETRTEISTTSSNDKKKCRIFYDDGVVTIRSEEEMAEQFVRHWTETVKKFVAEEESEEKFTGTFRVLGDDVVYYLKLAQQNMKKDLKRRDDIFDEEVVDRYLSDAYKRKNLRYYGRVYTSKAEFGQRLYAGLIASRDKAKKPYSRLPEGQKGMASEFNEILTMFSKGVVSRFLADADAGWQVDDDTLQIIRRIEQRMDGDRLNAKTVENLYRTAFRLRGNASHRIGGTTYKSYTEFSKELLELARSDMKSAAAVRKQCMTEEGRLKVDLYAWMQETGGVAVYPKEKEREQF